MAGAGTAINLSAAATDGVNGFVNVEGLTFVNTSGTSTATFNAAQFGAGKIATTAEITGTASTQAIAVNLAVNGSLDLSGWTFATWTSGTDTISLTGSTGAETIVGSSQIDRLVVGATTQVQATDRYDGGADTDVLQIGVAGAGTAINLSAAASDGVNGFVNIEGLTFVNTSGTSTATFNAAQFGAGKIATTAAVTGTASTQALAINLSAAGSFDLSGWTFSSWTPGVDTISLTGSTGGETITGAIQGTTILAGAGADTLIVSSTTQVQVTDRYDGGADTDVLQIGVAGAGTSIDLSSAASDAVNGFINIEGITFVNTSGTSTATFNAAQFGAGKIATAAAVTGTASIQAIAVNLAADGSFDLSGWTFTSWTSGTDTITVTGSTGGETITGAIQGTTILAGAGADTLIVGNTAQVQVTDRYDGGADADVLQIGVAGVGTAVDLSSAASDGVDGFVNIEGITFVNTSGTSTATFNAAQFGAGKIATAVAITGTASIQAIAINLDADGSLDLSGWTFASWTSGTDTITVTGSTGNETITGTAGNDTFNGGSGDDRLRGGGGNDTLNGGSGDDRLRGDAGADAMTGGIGSDVYYADNAADQVIEAMSGGTDTVYASVDYVLAAGQEVESLVVYGSVGLALTGNELANYLGGGAGNDTLNGGLGDDRLNGAAGADAMTGGIGSDVYYVDNAGDQVIEAVGGGTDTVYASVDYVLAAGLEVEYLRVYGSAGLTLTGNELDDYLAGGAGNDTLNGGSGNDRLYGGAGTDVMTGGSGADVYYVDNAADQVIEVVGEGSDNVYASVDYALAAGQEVEFLRVYGSAGLTLTGNELNDYLIGGAGDDTLNGGLGNDRLTGGAGNDTFGFNQQISSAINVDTITDYSVANDSIELSQTVFADFSLGQLTASDFALNSATGAGPQIVYNTTSGALFYDSNGADVGGQSQFATLTGLPSLTASEFFII